VKNVAVAAATAAVVVGITAATNSSGT
jgi:hypothetical protein